MDSSLPRGTGWEWELLTLDMTTKPYTDWPLSRYSIYICATVGLICAMIGSYRLGALSWNLVAIGYLAENMRLRRSFLPNQPIIQ